MVEQLLDKASYSIIRTNPKLTGNVKLTSNGKDIYLESFSANNELSSARFKAFKISGDSTYDKDVFKFFQRGQTPTDIVYEVFQEFQDVAVLSSYSNQYEMFYSAGTRSVASEAYSEDLGMLAPLWLKDQIPNYFVIFRIDNPAAVNNINATLENENFKDAQTSKDFTKNVLENCTAIKTFDLTTNSKLGAYIRNYKNQESFPTSPLTVSWRRDERILWNGISLQKGGFKSAGSYAYKDLIGKDSTIIQNEFFFTEGFQRNGILLANLLNMEFLFSDTNAPDYSLNRYFGLYVNEIEEGTFDISGEGFYKNSEKTQLPKIKTIEEVSETLNTPFEITNDQGVLVFMDPNRRSTITGYPTPQRVNEVESIFYVKDKNESFHTIKKGSVWGKDQIRLFDKKIDISVLAGFKEPDTFASALILPDKGKATVSLQILKSVTDGIKITFRDGPDLVGEVNASIVAAPNPGTSSFNSFCPLGTPQEIVKAITNAINIGIPENKRFFNATYNDDTVYVQSRYAGDRFNQLNMTIDFVSYPLSVDEILTYPVTDENTTQVNFVGGNNLVNSRLKVSLGDQDRFIKGNYVQTTGGFATIGDYVPYLEEPIKDLSGNIIGYTDVDKYVIINTDSDQVIISGTNQAALYKDYRSSFGRFSLFPIKDFDYDFYSDLYSELGELAFEQVHYNKGAPNNFTGISANPEVREFYDNGGFANLIGLLKDADPDETLETDITSPYQRLEENFIRAQAVASRVIPYINKWSWYNEGKDVRNHPYSLNLSEAFGINDFAPSKYAVGQDAQGFTHEWYYLSEFPEYFSNAAIQNSWSYVDKAPVDSIEANPLTGAVYTPGTFQRVDKNLFDDYFIVDRFTTGGSINLINRQIRYGRFEGGNGRNFAETFLRGVRIIAKPKASFKTKPNFNAKRLKYINNGEFNDYRFSVILVPNEDNKPQTQVKIIKNEKWKTVVMMIFLTLKNDCVNLNKPQSIDRTTLYSFESDYQTSSCEPIQTTAGGSYFYESGIMQGAINFNASSFNASAGSFLIQGGPDINGNPTRFLRDITITADGTFTDIRFEITTGPTPFQGIYEISGISKVLNDNQLFATTVTKDGVPYSIPNPNPAASILGNTTYTTVGGGFNTYSSRLTQVGFATLMRNINQGDPSILYETIKEDGTRVTNADGSIAQTFSLELRPQEDILKAVFLGVLPDPAKPTVFNLTDIIGYDLSLQKKPRITPIGRHAGTYEPTALDIIHFKDPYSDIDFDTITGTTGTGANPIPDELYKTKVFDLCRYANAQFNSSDTLNFGQIKNMFYHKVNEEDPSAVLELSTEGAFQSLYPLINEVGIDFKDFYMFSSNWEPSYFRKNVDKAVTESIIGTRSMKEKKSFFGSKYLKVPQTITLDTFKFSNEFNRSAIKQPSLVNGDFMVERNQTSLQFYLFIQQRLIEFLFTPIKEQFLKYVKPEFSFDDDETIDDDVRAYIKENILRLYKVDNVDLYVKLERARRAFPSNVRSARITIDDFDTAALTNDEKLKDGLDIVKNASSLLLNTNPFDLKLIYNKRKGFTESFGFSVTIVKK